MAFKSILRQQMEMDRLKKNLQKKEGKEFAPVSYGPEESDEQMKAQIERKKLKQKTMKE